MTTPEAPSAPTAAHLPIDRETYREFGRLYRWQELHGIDIHDNLDDSGEAKFGLLFWDGQGNPTYTLEVTRNRQVEKFIRFYTYQLGPQDILISPIAHEDSETQAINAEDIDLILRVIPRALAHLPAPRERKRRFFSFR